MKQNNIEESIFSCKHMVYETAPNVGLHFHDLYEIFWFMGGNVKYSVEGNTYNIKQGDILITNTRELHAPIFIDTSRYERCVIQIKPQFLSEFITEDFNPFSVFENRTAGVGNLIEASVAESHGLYELIKKTEEEYTAARPVSMALIKAYMIELLVMLSDITGSHCHAGNARISEIIKCINKNLASDLSLSVLEKNFFINKYYLSHLFKEQTGFSVGSYITQKRIIRAKELLLNGMSVSEAAAEVGFVDYSSFYRSFKRMMGKSPRDFLSIIK